MLLLIGILIFIAFAFLIIGMYFNIQYRRGHLIVMRRINKQIVESGDKNEPGFLSDIKSESIRIVSSLGDFVKPKSDAELSQLRRMFFKAGYRRESAPVIFFGIKIVLAVLFVFILFFLKILIFKAMSSSHFFLFSLILLAIGFYSPNIWLQAKIARRREKILEGFPDALDLMVVCVEAGNGLDAAISRVGEEMKLGNKVIFEEFKLLSLELRAGKTRRDALKNFALRTDTEDINSLITLLIQTEKFGTSIAQALRVYSDSMRVRRFQRAEEIAAKLPVKLVFPLILFIFPTLMVTIIGPAIIRIFRILFPALAA